MWSWVFVPVKKNVCNSITDLLQVMHLSSWKAAQSAVAVVQCGEDKRHCGQCVCRSLSEKAPDRVFLIFYWPNVALAGHISLPWPTVCNKNCHNDGIFSAAIRTRCTLRQSKTCLFLCVCVFFLMQCLLHPNKQWTTFYCSRIAEDERCRWCTFSTESALVAAGICVTVRVMVASFCRFGTILYGHHRCS